MSVYLNALSTILAMLTFFAISWWAFSSGRKAANRESALLPFVLPDEVHSQQPEGARP